MIERIEQEGLEIAGMGGYPSHNCQNSTNEHWHNQHNACYVSCGVCGKITGFHYKSFWKRLRALFNFTGVKPIK